MLVYPKQTEPSEIAEKTEPAEPEQRSNKQMLEEANRLKACESLSAEGRKHFNLIEFDANEKLVMEIRKHPIGLWIIVFIGVFVTLCSLLLASLVATADLNSFFGVTSLNNLRSLVVLMSFFITLIAAVGTFIGVFLYRSNVIYVTSEKIAQVLYLTLFNRKISQLSIGDVQDVTVTQKGILAHIFNYGVLVIETAGEQQNYTFSYVPDPYIKSKAIVGAHETNLTEYGN